jgi:hypothetical protein
MTTEMAGTTGTTTTEGEQHLQEATSDLVGQARQTAEQQVNAQMSAATSSLHRIADAVRETGQTLSDQQETRMVAPLADRAAEQVDRAASYLEGKDVTQLLSEVERFARREPVLFAAGGLAVGLVAARLLKGALAGSSMTGSSGYQGSGYDPYGDGSGTTGRGWTSRVGYGDQYDTQAIGDTPYTATGSRI